MFAIGSLFIIVIISILITRIATIALAHTGMSRQAARFQARSAFTGAGFTTSESENVVNHPIRRKIIMILMFLGNVGIVSAMSTLIISFVDQKEGESIWYRLLFLTGGIAILWMLAKSEFIDRHLSRIISNLLHKYTRLDIKDYDSLMHLSHGYRISELIIEESDWICEKTLLEARLRDEGIIILGIERYNGDYTGVPNGDTKIQAGDTLIVYGREKSLSELDERGKTGGEIEHRQAVSDQEKIQESERKRDEKAEEEAEEESTKDRD